MNLFENYDNIICPLFPNEHQEQLRKDKFKHIFEVKNILSCIEGIENPRVLDIGAGAGINALILKIIYNIDCTIIDRYTEFDEQHKRTAGSSSEVIKRLRNHNITVSVGLLKDEFIKNNEKFDVVTSMDVIEHLTNSPSQFVANMTQMLNKDGCMLIGTPNQQHIFNRVKSFFGMNTWEEFNSWFNAPEFFGHVRELTSSELKLIGYKFCNTSEITASSYPFRARLPFIGNIIDIVLSKFPSLSYYLILKGKSPKNFIDDLSYDKR